MIRIVFLFFLFSSIASATSIEQLVERISTDSLKSYITTLSSDAMEGRETGTLGQKQAADYIAKKFRKIGLESFTDNYLQQYDYSVDTANKIYTNLTGHNVIGFIRGNLPNAKTLIISAHYDHLGIKDSLVYNGADDNASGVAAIIEIARIFSDEAKLGNKPDNTILFIAFSGEEKGLLGSNYYVKNTVIPLNKCIANINIDMIGRIDAKHATDSNYVYVIGSEKIKKSLKRLIIKQNSLYNNLSLDFSFDRNDVNRYYYRSDHYNFAKNKIPIAFYFNGTHEDYHKPSDDVSKIKFELLTNRVKHIYGVVFKIAQLKKL
ncbi:MAG: M28 family peptidase [Bacteroidetes bacterium]|nr:M28 family peptidase [Bacteroidota bacterium]